MTVERTDDEREFVGHAAVPVADVEDARASARALERFRPERVTVVHVVEKGGGVPDKTPVEQSEAIAQSAYDAFTETFPEADLRVTYGRDVVAAIARAAEEIGASAIVFRPRGGSRLLQFLAGDRALRLVTETDLPVVSLPDPGGDASADVGGDASVDSGGDASVESGGDASADAGDTGGGDGSR